MFVDPSLHEAIDRAAAAAATFASGDPSGYAALVSAGDDVSIFGAFGSGVPGREETIRRMSWAAGRFAGGHVIYEPMAAGSSGDLGYAVGIERGRVTLVDGDGPGEIVLRVTQVFRREDGEWRLVHRHADPVASVTVPSAILADAAPGRAAPAARGERRPARPDRQRAHGPRGPGRTRTCSTATATCGDG